MPPPALPLPDAPAARLGAVVPWKLPVWLVLVWFACWALTLARRAGGDRAEKPEADVGRSQVTPIAFTAIILACPGVVTCSAR